MDDDGEPIPFLLSIALSVDLSPPPLWVWLDGIDLDQWQELLDCKRAFDRGMAEVHAERTASKRHAEWARKQVGA